MSAEKNIKENEKKVCNFLIDVVLQEKLKKYCEENDKKVGKVIERAISEYLVRNK